MRLKNKKLLLSLLLMSSWCYGLTPEEITKLKNDFIDYYKEINKDRTSFIPINDASPTQLEPIMLGFFKAKSISSNANKNALKKAFGIIKDKPAAQPTDQDPSAKASMPFGMKNWFNNNGILFVDALKKNNILNPNNITKDKLLTICRTLYLDSNKTFVAPFWTNFNDKNFDQLALSERMKADLKDAPQTFKVPDIAIDIFKTTLQKLLDGEKLSDLIPQGAPTTPKPGPGLPHSQGPATEQQITAWVNANGDKIVAQLKTEGFAKSQAITFAMIQAAAKAVKTSIVPETAQNSYVLGRLSSKGLPAPTPPKGVAPPPAPKGYKTQNPTDPSSTTTTLPPPPPGYKSQNPTDGSSSTTSTLPQTGGPKVNPPTGGPKAPPLPTPGATTSQQLKLDAAGQKVLVDLIKTKFDESLMSASETSKVLPTPPNPIAPPQSKQQAKAQAKPNESDLIAALELAAMLKQK